MLTIEQEIWEDFQELSGYNIETERFSYSLAKAHFGIKYEDHIPSGYGGNQFIRNDLDKKIDNAIKNGNINWEELKELYPNWEPIIVNSSNTQYPKAKFRSKVDREEIETILIEKWQSTQEYINYLFPSQNDALSFVANKRWGNNIKCPKCGHTDKIYFLNVKYGHRYKCGKCRKQFTETIGTIFENTKLPMVKWYEGIYLMTSLKTRKISSPQFAKALGLTQKSSFLIQDKIRQNINTKLIQEIRFKFR